MMASVIVALLLAAGAFVLGYLPRHRARAALEEGVVEVSHSLPRVDVIVPKPGKGDHAIALPGTIRPLEETTVYSRANGYVRRWLVDIGDKVTEGQLLAELDTPELDQELVAAQAQLAQAKAGIVQAQAKRDYSNMDLERVKHLAPTGITSQQELQQRESQAQVDEAAVTVADAAVGAQQANIKRLAQLKSFARVAAPFGGLITQRWIDRGALVTAGNGTPLYRISITNPVRVFVQVPQDVAPGVRAGAPAQVQVREYAGRQFAGTLARSAGALDATSRTMTTEVRVPNEKGELLTGMYAEVHLTLPSPHRIYELPATALYNDSHGLRVAVVDPQEHVHMVPVVVERDLGATIQVSSGLTGEERVVKLANAAFGDGTAVQVIK
jgi:RND family efflux transporter MFP subunit